MAFTDRSDAIIIESSKISGVIFNPGARQRDINFGNTTILVIENALEGQLMRGGTVYDSSNNK